MLAQPACHHPNVDIREAWRKDSFAGYALLPASWLYSLGWLAYRSIYQLGLKKPKSPHKPVVCVGNWRVGGTGKTPFTVFLVQQLVSLGRPAVISCSGYGSPRSEASSVAPQGPLDPREWGDEAALLRSLLPQVPLIVGRRRVLAGQLCHEQFPNHVLVMDDGLQHLPLFKHVKIALDPPTDNHRSLPAGPYREPYKFRQSVDLALPGGGFEVLRQVTGIRIQGKLEPVAAIKGKQANLLCALGSPEGFIQTCQTLGIEIAETHLMPDHHALQPGTLPAWKHTLPTLVTAKDAVKLSAYEGELWVVEESARVEPLDQFIVWLKNALP
ncbi:MAG: tetraacyldisaccharide 4'-kinase [Armatimonadetes bacterium]|nr:tetraacyldisaccharide 4'-kinase [Armatimonadota bacterium]